MTPGISLRCRSNRPPRPSWYTWFVEPILCASQPQSPFVKCTDLTLLSPTRPSATRSVQRAVGRPWNQVEFVRLRLSLVAGALPAAMVNSHSRCSGGSPDSQPGGRGSPPTPPVVAKDRKRTSGLESIVEGGLSVRVGAIIPFLADAAKGRTSAKWIWERLLRSPVAFRPTPSDGVAATETLNGRARPSR